MSTFLGDDETTRLLFKNYLGLKSQKPKKTFSEESKGNTSIKGQNIWIDDDKIRKISGVCDVYDISTNGNLEKKETTINFNDDYINTLNNDNNNVNIKIKPIDTSENVVAYYHKIEISDNNIPGSYTPTDPNFLMDKALQFTETPYSENTRSFIYKLYDSNHEEIQTTDNNKKWLFDVNNGNITFYGVNPKEKLYVSYYRYEGKTGLTEFSSGKVLTESNDASFNNVDISGSLKLKSRTANKYLYTDSNKKVASGSIEHTSTTNYNTKIANGLDISGGYLRHKVDNNNQIDISKNNFNLKIAKDTKVEVTNEKIILDSSNASLTLTKSSNNGKIEIDSKYVDISSTDVKLTKLTGTNKNNYMYLDKDGKIIRSTEIEAYTNKKEIRIGDISYNYKTHITSGLRVGGDFIVDGSTVAISTTNMTVKDRIIQIGDASETSVTIDQTNVDMGFVFTQNTGSGPEDVSRNKAILWHGSSTDKRFIFAEVSGNATTPEDISFNNYESIAVKNVMIEDLSETQDRLLISKGKEIGTDQNLVYTSTGLAIGKETPSAKLDVVGTTNIEGETTITGNFKLDHSEGLIMDVSDTNIEVNRSVLIKEGNHLVIDQGELAISKGDVIIADGSIELFKDISDTDTGYTNFDDKHNVITLRTKTDTKDISGAVSLSLLARDGSDNLLGQGALALEPSGNSYNMNFYVKTGEGDPIKVFGIENDAAINLYNNEVNGIIETTIDELYNDNQESIDFTKRIATVDFVKKHHDEKVVNNSDTNVTKSEHLFGVPEAPTNLSAEGYGMRIDISWNKPSQTQSSWGPKLPHISGFIVELSGVLVDNANQPQQPIEYKEVKDISYNPFDWNIPEVIETSIYVYDDEHNSRNQKLFISPSADANKIYDIRVYAYNYNTHKEFDDTTTTLDDKNRVYGVSAQIVGIGVPGEPTIEDKRLGQTEEDKTTKIRVNLVAPLDNNINENGNTTEPPLEQYKIQYSVKESLRYELPQQTVVIEYSNVTDVSQNKTLDSLYAGTTYDISLSIKNTVNTNYSEVSSIDLSTNIPSYISVGAKTHDLLGNQYKLVNASDKLLSTVNNVILFNSNVSYNINNDINNDKPFTLNGNNYYGKISDNNKYYATYKLGITTNSNKIEKSINILDFTNAASSASTADIGEKYLDSTLTINTITDQYTSNSGQDKFLKSGKMTLTLNNTVDNGTNANIGYGEQYTWDISMVESFGNSNFGLQTGSFYLDDLQTVPTIDSNIISASLSATPTKKYYYGITFIDSTEVNMSIDLSSTIYYSNFINDDKKIVTFATTNLNPNDTSDVFVNTHLNNNDLYEGILNWSVQDNQEPAVATIQTETTVHTVKGNTDPRAKGTENIAIYKDALANTETYYYVTSVTQGEIKYPVSISQKQHNEVLPSIVRIPLNMQLDFSNSNSNLDVSKNYSGINTTSTWHVFEVLNVSISTSQICDISDVILGEIGKYFSSSSPSVSDVSQILLSYAHGTRAIGTHWFDMKEHYSANLQFQSDTIENGEGCRNGDTTGVFYARFLDGGGTISKLYVAMNKLS